MVSAVLTNDNDWQFNQSYYVYKKPIEKPANDDREYRLIRLVNQLQVLLISDPETDRASAALDVHVGSLCDPEHLQGLAHFCEHLLFMGTKKYPKENDYSSYLSDHSGFSNAYTSTENTNYFFEVGHQWLEGALDRFSRFFIDPLFTESCVERELRAVDSEYKNNLQSDCWRVAQVEKSLSNPNHPWHKFETGNLETLMDNPKKRGLDIRQELLKFHDYYYSANIMKLTVIGKESLDQLTEWAVDMFSSVTNKSIPIPSFAGHPLTENEIMKQVFVKTVKNNRSLNVTFPFPDQTLFYECQPTHYLAYLMGHEGPGSLLSFLKKKNWASYLNAGLTSSGIGFSFFDFMIDLTEEGLAHYEDVIVSVFEYIEMIKETGIKKWFFDETKSLLEMDFNFSEKCSVSQYTSALSEVMQQNLPPQLSLSGLALLRKYDAALINQHLALLRPDNFRVTLACQEFPNGIQCTQVEKWYSTSYELLPLSESLTARLSNISVNDDFKFPAVNEFIPSKLDVEKFQVEEKTKKPELIQDTPVTRIWYKKDDTFWVPRTNMWVLFKNPLLATTPRNGAMSQLYIDLLIDSLSEYSYDAEIAGLSYYLSHESKGIELFIGGYNDKLPLLLEKIIDKMKNLQIKPERFVIIKEEIKRGFENYLLEEPYEHAIQNMAIALSDVIWTHDDILSEIKGIQLEDVQTYIPTIVSGLHIEGMVHGALDRVQVIQMFETIESILQPRPLMPSQFIGSRDVILPAGQKFVYPLSVQDPENVNSAINYTSQVCSFKDIPLRSRLRLVAQIAEEPCFNQLRTREQLGYLVFSGTRCFVSQMAFRLVIQSEKDPVYLENRCLEFLELLRTIISEMSEADYQTQVDSLVADCMEKNKNLWEEGNRYWCDISSGYYEFNDQVKDVDELKSITKESLLEFYDKWIMPDSPDAATISVHLKSQKTPPVVTEVKDNYTVDQLYPVLTYLELVNKKELSEDELKTLIADHGGDSKIQTKDGLTEFLSSSNLNLSLEDVDRVIIKINQGPSGLSTRNHDELPKGYTIIDDVIKFKREMPLSAAAVPFYTFPNV